MKNSRGLASTLWLFSTAITPSLFAQTLRCDLVGVDTTINGKPGKSCLDVSAIRNQTITIPNNVTRLDNDGFALCQSSLRSGGNADIVYVYDNSGSMASNDAYIDTLSPGVFDTLYYYGTGNCNPNTLYPNNSTWNVTYQYWDAAGTTQNSRTVRRLVSKTGCSEFSGDPFNARGRAYRLGIQSQAARAPTSMAGVMSFTSGTPGVANLLRPVALNAAGVSQLVGPPGNGIINSVANGGTVYTVPLDSSRIWLRTGTITPQTSDRTKAVIFLSDGQPSNTSYLPLNSAMPPVYGIFLGRDTVNTGRLRELATLTSGQFFLIPPNNPDSLISVVDRILNILLLQYNPSQVILTNNTIAPAQTSSSTGFLTQGDSVSWRVVLDNVVALNGGANNSMSMINTFQEATSGAIIRDTVNFGLSTTGPPAGGTQVINPYRIETRCYPVSRIQWQTNAGVRPPYFTEADSSNVRLRLRGSDSNMASAAAALSTKRAAPDAETGNLPRTLVFPDSTLFSNLVPMRVSATPTGANGFLQPKSFDSLIARWVHARDPRDSARDTIAVRPAQVVASAWFSDVSGGAQVSTYDPATTQRIWVVVQDNELTPGLNYQITVSSDSLGGDVLVLPLVPVAGQPGKFTAEVPFQVISVKSGGDGVLQISPGGDLLHAVYIDPFYSDRAEAVAGFGVSVQETPVLVFTDAAGVALADSVLWPMARGQVFVKYNDDHSASLTTKPIRFQVTSLKLGATAGTDQESATLRNSALAGGSQTLRTWTDSFPTAETLAPAANNGTLQGAYRMVVVASVDAHDNKGVLTGQTVSRTLILAHPDSLPSLTFQEHVNRVDSTGPVDVIFTLRDQDFVRNTQDTIVATPTCPLSGDSVGSLRFIQQSPGVYVSDTLFRNGNTANLTDRLLSCPSGGDMVVRYVDEVYGTVMTWTIHEAAMPVAQPTGPVANPNFYSQVSVALSTATQGALITYTQNNALPTPGQPIPYSAPLQLIASDTIKAIASAPGYLRSWVMTEIYQRHPKASQIVILDANGNTLPGKTVTDAATALKLKVITSQGGLSGVIAEIASKRMADNESPLLQDPPLFDGQAHTYSGNIALRGGAATHTNLNDTLETNLPDTLIAVWNNPLDPSDVVRDTVVIVASYAQSSVCFTAVSPGPCVTQFNNPDNHVFVRVQTRTGLSGTYATNISTGPTGGNDTDGPFTLTETVAGSGIFYSASIPLNENTPKISGNGSIQVSSFGDQLTATFVHPVYKDTSRGVAGYGRPPEAPATLVFLSPTGVALPNNPAYQNALYYSLANDSVRVKYTDDWSSGIDLTLHTKKLYLVLDILRSGLRIAGDTESVDITYDTAAKAWFGAASLKDLVPASRNGTLESQFRGQLLAFDSSHTNLGILDGSIASANLLIAYPDQPASIDITDPRGGVVGRLTDSLKIVLHDQIFSSVTNPPTLVAVRVSCQSSGDHEDLVWLRSNGDGTYSLVPPMPKDEILVGTPVPNDGKLSCRVSDIVRVDYVDPVFGGVLQKDVGWSEPSYLRIHYASTADTSLHIVSILDGSAPNFTVVIEAPSPSRDKVDTLYLVMTTPQGTPQERETFAAVETGPYTGVFTAVIPFGFSLSVPAPGNRKVDAQLNPALANNSVVATGTVVNGPNTTDADITLFSQYHAARRGYALDANGDGQVDSMVFVFDQKLTQKPSSLDSLFWNSEAKTAASVRSAAANQISISPDSLSLRVSLSSNPFPISVRPINGGNYRHHLTDLGSPRPVGVMPKDAYFGGLRVALEDSVGPVPDSAVKKPSDLTIQQCGAEKCFKPDTLEIWVSEPIKSSDNWNGVFRFSTVTGGEDCNSDAVRNRSNPIPTWSEPTPDPTTNPIHFTLLADQILAGSCIYLERGGRFLDLANNKPGKLGIKLDGANASPNIRDWQPWPPVTLDPKDPAYPVGNPPGILVLGGKIQWIEPWKPGDGSIDNHGITDMPSNISAIRVLTLVPYKAQIHLFDHLGNFVKAWEQDFGHHGELSNRSRILSGSDKGVSSFLAWDKQDSKGQLAGQGVFIWKVTFIFDTGRREVRIMRTGLMRH